MTEHMHAGMTEHRRQSLRVSRNEFAGDQERAIPVRWGLQPCLQSKVQPLSDCTYSSE